MSGERAHGTRARYLYGAGPGTEGPGCRCGRCRRANSAYKAELAVRGPSSGRRRRRAHLDVAPVPVEVLAGAMCRAGDVPTGVFFPLPADVEGAEVAKAICAGCPVRVACLEYAVDHFEQHGVWGGTTPDERIELRKATA